MDYIPDETLKEFKEKYLSKLRLSDEAVQKIKEIYHDCPEFPKMIVERLLQEIKIYRKDNKELADKLADAWFKK